MKVKLKAFGRLDKSESPKIAIGIHLDNEYKKLAEGRVILFYKHFTLIIFYKYL